MTQLKEISQYRQAIEELARENFKLYPENWQDGSMTFQALAEQYIEGNNEEENQLLKQQGITASDMAEWIKIEYQQMQLQEMQELKEQCESEGRECWYSEEPEQEYLYIEVTDYNDADGIADHYPEACHLKYDGYYAISGYDVAVFKRLVN